MDMKKFMYAAMAALAITSCSQNEEFEAPSQKVEIGFNTMVSKTTRAAVANLDTLKKDGFTVYAYNTGTTDVGNGLFTKPIMEGVKVTFSTNWTMTGTFYWPLTDKVQFYAYATNAGAEYVVPTTGYPAVNYTVSDVVAEQKDFVVSKVENAQKSAGTGEVALLFAHALTQVNFSVKAADANIYKISEVKITGVANKGTYSFANGGKWSIIAGTTGSYSYPLAENHSFSGGNIAASLDQTNGALMLMPQALPDNANISISYTVLDAKGQVISSADKTLISLKGTTAWEAGKKVRYTLELDNDAVAISFKPEVGNWDGPDVEGGKPIVP